MIDTARWYQISNVDEIASPAMLLYPDRVRENLNQMVRMVGSPSRLRPHVKTHKLSQVVRMKLEAGITKFKTSTIAEAEMTAAAGGKDVLLAFQPVGPNIGRFIELNEAFPETQFSTLVDNLEVLDQLEYASRHLNDPIGVFIDLNVGMHRSGMRAGSLAIKLYEAIGRKKFVKPCGFHAYDGHLKSKDFEERSQQVEEAFKPVWELREQVEMLGFQKPAIIGGGTPTSAILAKYPDIEVGMGTPVLWDYGQAQVCPEQDFLWAAVLLARVVSRPTENRLCIDLGHKAVASEMPQPRVHFFGLEDAKFVMHSEEHLVLESDHAMEFAPGDELYGIPQHICPTMALHQMVHVVREHQVVESWPIEARNRRLYI
jgi:D-serine deaminase-like pyridoxal phosphate-dependent protein